MTLKDKADYVVQAYFDGLDYKQIVKALRISDHFEYYQQLARGKNNGF